MSASSMSVSSKRLSRTRNAVNAVVETMENRQMMSVSLMSGVLNIVGRDSAILHDSYSITQNATHLTVNENGVVRSFLNSSVSWINASLLAGNDTLNMALNVNKSLVANGGAGNDTIRGGLVGDSLYGAGGTDSLFGNGGNDWIDGGVGGVAVYADNTGNDFLCGGDGNDVLHASDWGNNKLQGDAGDDALYGYHGNDYILCGLGNDYANAYRGNDVVLGGDGNDQLQGGGGTDGVYGEAGNDLIDGGTFGAGLVADNDGADIVRGGAGDDTVHAADYSANRLFGDDGNDTLYGYAGNDFLNGGAGLDTMNAGAGNDVIIAIDGNYGESIYSGSGTDVVWGDRVNIGIFFSLSDSHVDASSYEASKMTRMVSSFRNGADKTLNGDAIADPTDGTDYKNFSANPLFAPQGPTINDIDQEALGDCWMLGQAGSLAHDNPDVVRSMVVEFGDGTYGVALGSSFYRVDGDLPTWNAWSTDQKFAGLGQSNSLWVAILEKAYTHHRTGANTYASLSGGDPADALRQMHGTGVGQNYYGVGSNGATIANDIFNHWNAYQNTTICTGSVGVGSPLVGGHCYSVYSVSRVNGVVTSVTVRNPWGGDNTSGNPFVVLSPAQLSACQIWVTWGNS